ncbi:MAG: hypothetical protein WAQ05_26165 [Rubrivivax sp.]
MVWTRPAAMMQRQDGALELWTELLAQLSHAASDCARPDVVRRLKRIGVRRTGTVAVNLDREYMRASQMAMAAGCTPQPQAVLLRAQTLLLRDDLQQDLHDLARTYQQLLQLLAPPSGTQRHRWLVGRARVHLAQAEALRRDT